MGAPPSHASLAGRSQIVRRNGEQHVPCRRESILLFLLETALDDEGNLPGQVGPQRGDGPRLAFEDASGERDARVSGERVNTGRKLVQHDAECKQVGPHVDLAAIELLGSHV